MQELKFRYSYEEFADHLKAMKLVRQWEYTARFGHLGDAQTSRAHSARVVEYFSDSYQSLKEAVHKAELFLSINDYLGQHAAWFAARDLMEAEGTQLSAEPALLRAVHHLFTTTSRPAQIPPKKVLALARAFKDAESGR